MLQTQHTIASQNWQRIEGSLQHRNESLEKETNDLSRRWEEEKKKLKDSVAPTSHHNTLVNGKDRLKEESADANRGSETRNQVPGIRSPQIAIALSIPTRPNTSP